MLLVTLKYGCSHALFITLLPWLYDVCSIIVYILFLYFVNSVAVKEIRSPQGEAWVFSWILCCVLLSGRCALALVGPLFWVLLVLDAPGPFGPWAPPARTCAVRTSMHSASASACAMVAWPCECAVWVGGPPWHQTPPFSGVRWCRKGWGLK